MSERKGILIEEIDLPFSKSLKLYVQDWIYMVKCLSPFRHTYEWPEWTSKGEKKHYVSKDDPRYDDCFMYVDCYETDLGTVLLHKPSDCPALQGVDKPEKMR